jgi:hypothetical protein
MKTPITLSQPVQHGDEEIYVLELRAPTAGDVMECGYPLTIGDGEATPNAAVIGKLIARLAGVPPSVVKQLPVVDFQICLGVVLGFFGG